VIIPPAAVAYRLFWFKPATFAAAWNLHGSLLEGMGSSIALTLWAFLGWNCGAKTGRGREPETRRSASTLVRHAGCRYSFPTTVIRYAECGAGRIHRSVRLFMQNVQSDDIIMALGRHGLSRSLPLQFTIAQTGKSALISACSRLLLEGNSLGAPVIGMVVRECAVGASTDDHLANP
jgi:putrescine:ornithine antiporter